MYCALACDLDKLVKDLNKANIEVTEVEIL